MRRDAEFYSRAADRGKVSRIEIALAEMDEIAAGVDRLPPIIIDDEFCAVLLAKRLWLFRFRRGVFRPAYP